MGGGCVRLLRAQPPLLCLGSTRALSFRASRRGRIYRDLIELNIITVCQSVAMAFPLRFGSSGSFSELPGCFSAYVKWGKSHYPATASLAEAHASSWSLG